MLGLFLFPVNLLPLRKVITDHGVSYEFYADNNQLYIVFSRSEELILLWDLLFLILATGSL